MTCVFESFEKKEEPDDIQPPERRVFTLFSERVLDTDPEKAARVYRSLEPKMGREARELIEYAFWTNLQYKERRMLEFLRLGFQAGPKIMSMLTDERVHVLDRAVHFLTREAHLYKGFVRFTVHQGAMAAEIEPKNYVLPLLAPHFADRYPDEAFLIYDKTHKAAAVCQRRRWEIVEVEDFTLPEADDSEQLFRDLWTMFYDVAAVRGRENPRCRMNLMPKRYWGCMTEFQNRDADGNPHRDRTRRIGAADPEAPMLKD